jgi:hypothetical protein
VCSVGQGLLLQKSWEGFLSNYPYLFRFNGADHLKPTAATLHDCPCDGDYHVMPSNSTILHVIPLKIPLQKNFSGSYVRIKLAITNK